MAKVLVLYYSSFGHIETDGLCGCGRRACGGRDGRRQAGAGERPRGDRQGLHFKLDQSGADRQGRRAWRTMTRSSSARRLASAACPRRWAASGSRPAQLWMSGALTRKSRRRLHLERDPARRQRNDPFLHHRQPDAFRPGHRRPALQPRRPDDARRDRRRSALWRNDDRGRAGPAPADARSNSTARGIRAS